MQPLTTYIQRPELLTDEVVRNLQHLVDHNPSFQTARLLYLLGLYQLQDDRFGTELRKAAICLPDRRKLFDLFENQAATATAKATPNANTSTTAAPNETAPNVEKPANEGHADESQTNDKAHVVPLGGDRTQTLIDSFLSQLPEPAQPRHTRAADATVDYMSYLMQLEDAEPVQNPDNEEGLEEETETPEKVTTQEATLVHKNDPSDTYFTETLARIYIKQGKYAKAIEIIRRISLIYPKKNRYFADQIRFLEKLIVNERALNEEN